MTSDSDTVVAGGLEQSAPHIHPSGATWQTCAPPTKSCPLRGGHTGESSVRCLNPATVIRTTGNLRVHLPFYEKGGDLPNSGPIALQAPRVNLRALPLSILQIQRSEEPDRGAGCFLREVRPNRLEVSFLSRVTKEQKVASRRLDSH